MDRDAETAASGTQVTHLMQKKNWFAGALVALCLIGMLALPAAAAPATTMAFGNGAKLSTVDQGLRDDLWANHQQYRLARYDMNMEQAGSVNAVLGKYNVSTTESSATLTTIGGKRVELETALAGKDREQLKTVNNDLKTLWKQFLKDVRNEIRSHYGRGASGSAAADVADSLGLGSE